MCKYSVCAWMYVCNFYFSLCCMSVYLYIPYVGKFWRGKILEGENFGELMALKSLARKNLANLLVVY